MIDTILSLVAPHSCCGCGEVGIELCEGCKHNIIEEGFSVCVGCIRPTHGDNLCSACKEFPFTAFWCAGWRQTELKNLLDRYKFEALRSAGAPLVELLDAVVPSLPDGTVVTVVPTAPGHSRERGFDHMGLVGRAFAKRRGLSFQQMLRRTSSETQHFKSKRERLEAAKKTFELTTDSVPRSILLLDDILTTGATMRVNAALLKNAGVESLYGAIIARQPLDENTHL